MAGCWDSNGDGIGDFEGIRRHLDDLIDMGITGLRFQHVTRFDDDFEWYGLVAQDWFDVDPVYGTIADFDRLMADCRARDGIGSLRNYLSGEVIGAEDGTLTVDLGRFGFKLFRVKSVSP